MEKGKLEWQDPENIGMDVLKPRTVSLSYDQLEAVLNNEHPNQLDLKGLWSFCSMPMDEQGSEALYSLVRSQGTWTQVQVPSELKSESESSQMNTIGFYQRHFHINRNDNATYYLHMGTVSPACYVWVNGQAVGFSVNGVIATEFLITPYIRDGKNDIVIGILGGYVGDALVNGQNIFGLLGDVLICIEPHVHIYDYFAQFKLHEHGLFSLEAEVCNHGALQAPIQMLVTIYDWENQPVYVLKGNMVIPAGTSKTIVLTDALDDIFLWSAETPHLYRIVMTLKTPEGYVIQHKQFQYGFRVIGFENGVFTINHQPVKLKGVNYHAPCEKDSSDSRIDQYKMHLTQMKHCHINAIRTAGLIYEPEFYQLCNQMGFYVLDEAYLNPEEDKNGHHFSDNPKWTKAIIHRVMGMIERDKNHSCVIAWSLGPGLSVGENVFVTKKIASGRDYSRPYCYGEGMGDLLGLRFPKLALLEAIGEKKLPEKSAYGDDKIEVRKLKTLFQDGLFQDKPFFLLAYAPIFGNSMGDLEQYQSLFKRYDHLAGGFIWQAYGLFAKDHTQNPLALEVKKVFQPISMTCKSILEHTYEITNDYHFKTIKGMRLDWDLLEDGVSIATGSVGELTLGPCEKKTVTLLVGDFEAIEGAEYHMNLLVRQVEVSPYFTEEDLVAYEQFSLPHTQSKKVAKMCPGSVQVYDKKIKVEIIGEGFLVRISKLTGDLTSIMYDEQECLLSPLRLNFTRAKTDHDLTDHPKVHQRWEKAELGYSVKKVIIEDLKEQVLISIYRQVKGMRGLVKTDYSVNSLGHIQMDVTLTPKSSPIRIGTTFETASKYHQVAWYGKGSHEHYQDRNTSALVGVYECTLNDFIHHYMRPQENANRTDIRWVTLTTDEGEGLMIEDVQDQLLNFSVWPCTQKALAAGIPMDAEAQQVTVNVDLGQQGVGKYHPSAQQADRMLKANQTYTFGFKISKVY